jgi:hypothetical protein
MATTNPLDFLLNRDHADPAVSAPAFSITKVLTTGVGILTPLAGLLAARLGSLNFSAAEVVTLTVALLGFLAIVTTADVISRSLVTVRSAPAAAQSPVDGAEKAHGVLFEFQPVRKGILHVDGPDPDVQILAGRGRQLLVAEQGKPLTWVAQEQVTFC